MKSVIHASTGGRTFLIGHTTQDCVPGTLRHLGRYTGRSTTPMQYEPPAIRGRLGTALTPESQVIAFAEAFQDAAAQMRLAHPDLQPADLREALESRILHCDGSTTVAIDVYEYEPIDSLAALLGSW